MRRAVKARRLSAGLIVCALIASAPPPAAAFQPEVLDSVVSVLPLWPGHGGQALLPPGQAPEGTAVAVAPGGYLATALHVVARAEALTVRLADGRLRDAELVGRDGPSDLALLRIADDLPVLPWGETPALASPVCAVGNQFGLGLSVTCGVVSGVGLSGVGFNPIEDFIQTDATVNPGASGGALIDAEGRLVGLLSAIFTKESDASIGVNVAASAALVRRVATDLIEQGRVIRGRSGLRVGELSREARTRTSGAQVVAVTAGGAAEAAGLRVGDIVTRIAGRTIRQPSHVTTAVALHRPGDTIDFEVLRDGGPLALPLTLD